MCIYETICHICSQNHNPSFFHILCHNTICHIICISQDDVCWGWCNSIPMGNAHQNSKGMTLREIYEILLLMLPWIKVYLLNLKIFFQELTTCQVFYLGLRGIYLIYELILIINLINYQLQVGLNEGFALSKLKSHFNLLIKHRQRLLNKQCQELNIFSYSIIFYYKFLI